jgi:tetratricopeptide (TPR) repeat protein
VGRALFALVLLLIVGVVGLSTYRQLWADYHSREAERALQRRDFDAAQAHLRLCLEVWRSDPETHFLLARTARRAGSYGDAEQHLSQCKKLGWIPEAIALERALMEAQRDDPADVEGYLLSCVHQDHPDSVLILEALTQGYLRKYRLLQALDCLELWLRRQPDDVQALAWRGETYERMRNDDPAIDDYRRVVGLDPTRDDVRLRMVRLLIEGHRPDEAVGHCELLYQRQPGNPQAVIGLAVCRREQGRTEEARQLLDLLLAAEPRHPQALTERGKLALDAGQLEVAEEWLRKAVAVGPYERDAVYAFCQCLQGKGKQDEVKGWLERLKRIDADRAHMNDLMRALTLAPRDPNLRAEAGVIMLRNGHDEAGLHWLSTALQEQPGCRLAHRALADYFERQGNAAEAAYHRRLAGPAPPQSSAPPSATEHSDKPATPGPDLPGAGPGE